MSPIQVDGLLVLVLDENGGELCGRVETVLPGPGASLTVKWGAKRPPADWSAAAGGLLHYRDQPVLARSERADTSDIQSASDGTGSVKWSVVPALGDPLAVALLPPGMHVSAPEPAPIEVIEHAGREAVLWRPRRRPVTWTMRATAVPAEASPIGEGSRSAVLRPVSRPEYVEGRGAHGPFLRRATAVLAACGLAALCGVGAFLLAAHARRSATSGTGTEVTFRGVHPIVEDEDGGELFSYARRYGLVIGIDRYPAERWQSLNYACKDAGSVARYLEQQGYDEVVSLYNEKATKQAILHTMQNDLAPRVAANDCVFVFFAGHGHTERLGGQDWGYIVPYDGGETSAGYISMEEIQSLSRKMGTAKHQLYVLDACYGGMLASRGSGVDPGIPDYVREITRRKARQVLTAGGKDQRVADGGPGGHSVFTGHMLEALKEGLADTNGDGYITFAELVGYVVPRATNPHQTPAASYLPGHGLGEFVFRVEKPGTEPAGKRATAEESLDDA